MKGISLLAILFYEYSRFFVLSPRTENAELLDIKHSYANFGIIPYGSTIMGKMIYNEKNSDACSEFEGPIDISGDPDPDISPFVLVNRGSCSFVTKARNVQRWGGRIAVIINDRLIDSPDRIIMIDDGTGADVFISSILISRESGDHLLAILKSGRTDIEPIVLALEFKIENPDNRVEYDLYYSLGDTKALQIMKEMKPYHERLGATVYFTPHFVVNNVSYSMDECLFDGKYCMAVTDRDSIKSTGKELLAEVIRQKCIYQMVKEDDNANKFFTYIENVVIYCNGTYTADCSLKVINSFSHKRKPNSILRRLKIVRKIRILL
jgi:hypothetical protein